MEYTKVNAISITHINDGYGQPYTELYVNQVHAAVAYIFAYRTNTDNDEVLFVPTGIKIGEIDSTEAVLTVTSEEAEVMLDSVGYMANFDAVIVDRFSLTEKYRFHIAVKNTIV